MDTIYLKKQLETIAKELREIPLEKRSVQVINAKVIAEVILQHLTEHPEQVLFDLQTYRDWAKDGIGERYIQYVCRQNGHNIEVHDTVGVCTNCLEMGKELQREA